MAKESMKAREVKRAKLVEKYAAKRAKLKEEGDYAALSLRLETLSDPFAQPLQTDWTSQRLYETIWYQPYPIP